MLNFNSGPAALPESVLREAAKAVVNYNDTGLSILSIPHRGHLFQAILDESRRLVHELCGLDDSYEVLWMHGGGRLQFCMVPMNFLSPNHTAGYIDSGHWSKEAMDYARHYGDIMMLSSSAEDNYCCLPEWPEVISKALSYVHVTTNNTIYGTQWSKLPKTAAPLVADMSSDIFSRAIDYTNCSMFYAVAQKNIGPAGATLVVIKKDLLKKANQDLPPMLSYTAHVNKGSVLNTPPVFAIYVSMLMLRWTKERGIAGIEGENNAKAAALYQEIDRNSLFYGVAKKEDRSKMNACFAAHNKAHEKAFIEFCAKQNITGIEGHRSIGGLRASLYNSVSLDDVKQLVATMQAFEKQHS